ncbi:MAG: transglutaminase [Deferribacteres bacterium]|nr:transglutaminase [Deferribacteres bacterium]
MNWLERRIFRIISVIVLFFFSWTFAGIFDIAYAVKNSSKFKVQSSKLKRQNRQRPEEKLTKAIEDIKEILDDPVINTCAKNERLKEKKSEIEEIDRQIRKQFKETEKKLKEAGLPEIIQKRHKDFVKKYEDNLKELKRKIQAIGQATTVEGEKEAIEEAKEQLEKLTPPEKHKPIDPNKLPHRTAEPVFKEPRTNKEQFKVHSVQYRQKAPILVASAGSLEGLLTRNLQPATRNLNLPNLELRTQNSELFLLAVTDPPTSDDLSETVEVQFTEAIRAKAAELQHNPVKIYNWVRNNIEFVPTYGSIQGADMCLQSKQCNAFDTASLLIALLRVSGIHARYVEGEGTVEIPIEKVMNWVGGFTEPIDAINLLATAGIPVKGMVAGGQIKYAQIEHIWVEAWIDYFPSRGARHKPGKGDTWISLDASFKTYNYTQGIDIQAAVPFDAQTFIQQIQATATINEEEGYTTGIDSTYINQTMTDYQTQVEDYINQNHPDATVGDVLGKKEIIKQEFPYLLGTLPYRTIVRGAKYAEIPDNLRHKITFSVKKDNNDDLTGTPINITKSLPELAGKKITLSYAPATQTDQDIINAYLPKPHADGTPIEPSELPASLPAYLINLKPELRIDGEIVATGTTITMGQTEEFKMTFSGPDVNYTDIISNDIQAGEYLGIGIDPYRISEEQLLAMKAKLESTKAKLEAEDFTNLTKDDILGDLLYTTAISYLAEHDAMDYVSAKTMGVLAIRLPSETIFSYELSITKFMDTPLSVSAGGLSMDADRIMTLVKALDGDKGKQKQFMLNAGMNGSALEHSVPEQLFSTPDNPAEGISAVKALKIANDQGIPIYTINQANTDTILPQLQLDSGTISDIQNAINAGKTVTVSQTEINFNGWTGVGYIIIDPETGAGAYMISGGLSGGVLLLATILLVFSILFLFLAVITSGTGIGLIAFGFMAFAFAYGAIVTLYGQQAADEFFTCLALGELDAVTVIDQILKQLPKGLAILSKIFIPIVVYDFMRDLKQCLQGLYFHLFEL